MKRTYAITAGLSFGPAVPIFLRLFGGPTAPVLVPLVARFFPGPPPATAAAPDAGTSVSAGGRDRSGFGSSTSKMWQSSESSSSVQSLIGLPDVLSLAAGALGIAFGIATKSSESGSSLSESARSGAHVRCPRSPSSFTCRRSFCKKSRTGRQH